MSAETDLLSPPVILGPGANHSLLLHLRYTANAGTGAACQADVGCLEH